MRRLEKVLAFLGTCAILLGAFLIGRGNLPTQAKILNNNHCHTPVTVLQPPVGVNAIGAAILLHGLSANRRVMTFLGTDFAEHGFQTYLLDLPGHGDDTVPFSFAKAEECADAALASLIRNKTLDANRTIVLGHSMGAAIAIRMADHDPVAATIAISPAPMALPERMPANLLVFTGEFDIGVLKTQARNLGMIAGGTRIAPGDFRQQRAFRLQYVSLATHTSQIVDRGVADRSVLWAMQSIVPDIATRTLSLSPATSRSGRRLRGGVIGLLGLLFLFPACATLASRWAHPGYAEARTTGTRPALALAEGAVAGLAAIWILTMGVPLRFLHLYEGDYLSSLLLIVGVLLLALQGTNARNSLPESVSKWTLSALLGLATMLALGIWLHWQFGVLWLNGARWLRFSELVPVMFVFSFAEEVVLGPVCGGLRRLLRFGVSMIMRLELWMACVLAYYSLANGQELVGVLVIGLASFSVLQRLGTDALRLRMGSAAAAALFSAILGAWFIAAVFPLS